MWGLFIFIKYRQQKTGRQATKQDHTCLLGRTKGVKRTYLLEAAVHHLQLSLRELGQLTERVQGFRSKVNVRTVHLLKFAV